MEDFEVHGGRLQTINPLFGTPGVSTPQSIFGQGLQSNPAWSPDEPSRPTFRLSQAQQPLPMREQPVPPAQRLDAAEAHDQQLFSTINANCQASSMTGADIIASYANALIDHADAVREEASKSQRGLWGFRAQKLVQDLEAEAATWKLLYLLHGVEQPTFPGGTGGPPLRGCGSALRSRQQAAALIMNDQGINRLARVVTWLEGLAGDELDREEAAAHRTGGARVHFSEREGLPLETRDALQAQGQGASTSGWANPQGVVSELDPDASTRQGKKWAGADASDGRAISERVWRLVRAGRMSDAKEMCRRCGQAWRAATLGSPSAGPVVLGAVEPQDEESVAQAQESIAAEVDLGGNAMRAMWRSTCYKTADLLADEDKFEAAVFGIFGGNLARVLPLCSTWHDRLWAQARSWLEAELDDSLAPPEPANADPISKKVALLAEKGALARGSTPMPLDWSNPEASSQASRSWEAVEANLGPLDAIGVPGQGYEDLHRVLQWHLIGGANSADVDNTRLIMDLLPNSLVEALLDQRFCIHSWLLRQVDSLPEQQVLQEGSEKDGTPEAGKLLRFAAHLGLSLVDLGQLPDLQAHETPELLQPLQVQVNDTLARYLRSLLRSRQYGLIPVYACRLQREARRQLCADFLSKLTKEDDEEVNQAAYKELFESFAEHISRCRDAEELLDGPDGPQHSGLDLEDNEMDVIVEMVANQLRWDTSATALLRAQGTYWLWSTSSTLPLALRHTAALMREFALGGPAACEAALQLTEHLPQVFADLLLDDVQDILDMRWWEGFQEDEAFSDPQIVTVIRDSLLELFAWNQHFLLYSTYQEWQEQVDALTDDVGVAVLRESGSQLLANFERFLSPTPTGQTCLLDSVTCSGDTIQAGEFKMLVCSGEDEGAYQPWDPEDAQQLAQHLQRLLTATISPSEASTFSIKVSPVPLQSQSFLEIEAQAASPKALQRATSLLTLAIKGSLAEATSPLQGVNMVGAATAQVQMCKAVAIPSAMLKAAALRQWLVENGAQLDVGASLLPLLAGEDVSTGYQGLSPHFAPAELAAFLEVERKTRACRYPEFSELEHAQPA